MTKSLKKAFGFAFLLVSISACGAEEETATYTLKQDDEHVTVQNIYKEDNLLQQIVTNKIQYKIMGVETKKKAEKVLAPIQEIYSDKEGISYTMTFNEKEAVETIEIDLKKVSSDNLKNLPLISLPDENVNEASEKENGEKLKKLGFEKTK